MLSQFFRQKLPLIGLKNGSDLLTYPPNCAGTYRVRRRQELSSKYQGRRDILEQLNYCHIDGCIETGIKTGIETGIETGIKTDIETGIETGIECHIH